VRTAGLLLCYVAGVFVGGALLAPWLFHLAQWAAGEFPTLQGLAGQPFHRYVNRCLLVVAVAGLWPLLRALNLADRRALGLVNPLEARRPLALGLALGFGSLLVAAVLMALAGVRTFNFSHAVPVLLKLLVNATLSAVAVALLEETIFRGVVFGALRRAWSLWPALLVSAALYSVVHFLARVQHTGPVEWTSGLALLPRMMRGIAAPEHLLPALTLTLAGVALGLAYQRTGNLWFSIGLHAGWVFWLKVFKTVTTAGAGAGGAFWGTEKLLDGWLAFLVMAAVLAVVARLPQTTHTPANPDEPGDSEPRA
jgi:membrane protease YdiL (CAAX protease family)